MMTSSLSLVIRGISMTKQEKYQLFKLQGICPQCKQPWEGTQVMCDSCRAKQEDNRRKRRQARQAAGLCNRCGKHPAIEGTKYCEECAEKAKKHKDSKETKKKRLIKYHQVYKPQLQAKRIEFKEKGLCADCGKLPLEFGIVCKDCYSKRRKWYEKSKLQELGKTYCDGDCVNCMLPWCVDTEDNIQLTTEEKQLSKQLDREAKSDEVKWKQMGKKDLKNAMNRYNYNMATIADLESRKELGEVLSQQQERKLKNAQRKVVEARAYIETHSDGFISL